MKKDIHVDILAQISVLKGETDLDLKHLKKVDLPQPDGPTTAIKPFFGTLIDRLFKTGSGPVCVL